MDNLDAIQINFNPDQLLFLNICLAFLMFGVALDIRRSDFEYVIRNPKAPLIGLCSQLILLPTLTITLIYLLEPPISLAIGMVLLSVCPGGNVSNFMVHLARANAALSVSLTSIVTLSSIIVTPLSFGLWSSLIPGVENFAQEIAVNPADMFKTIFTLIVIPLSLGMGLNHYYPAFTDRIRKPVKWFSILIFLGFVVAASLNNLDNIINYLGVVFSIVMIHNGCSFLMGYHFARFNGLPLSDTRAIAIETGIQNSGLALIIIFNFFDGQGGMAMIAAWWGIWHLVVGFFLATLWSKQPNRAWSWRSLNLTKS
ncbi:MAG: bile acid:sodium symporter family protein [Bacteroidota bacterium]